jgi:hypothetical protein
MTAPDPASVRQLIGSADSPGQPFIASLSIKELKRPEGKTVKIRFIKYVKLFHEPQKIRSFPFLPV